jgi:hypothetical protein
MAEDLMNEADIEDTKRNLRYATIIDMMLDGFDSEEHRDTILALHDLDPRRGHYGSLNVRKYSAIDANCFSRLAWGAR